MMHLLIGVVGSAAHHDEGTSGPSLDKLGLGIRAAVGFDFGCGRTVEGGEGA